MFQPRFYWKLDAMGTWSTIPCVGFSLYALPSPQHNAKKCTSVNTKIRLMSDDVVGNWINGNGYPLTLKKTPHERKYCLAHTFFWSFHLTIYRMHFWLEYPTTADIAFYGLIHRTLKHLHITMEYLGIHKTSKHLDWYHLVLKQGRKWERSEHPQVLTSTPSTP